MISSLQASSPTEVIFGQFTEGLCKQYIRRSPCAGFMIMTLDKELWRGKASFTHTAQGGPEFEMYNQTPMFRYNAYFGVHTVYYMDLVGQTGRERLPMGQVVLAAVKTMIARQLARNRQARPVLNLWTQALFNRLDNLKFLAYIGADGFPAIVPIIQAQAADAEQILFAASTYRDELEEIPDRTPVAVLGMTLQMEDVLVRGEMSAVRRLGGIRCGRVRADWVYSPMPPKPQQIYPPVTVEPVTHF